MRYLAAKKSVDDRALNWRVWQCLVAALPRAPTEQPLRILEVGAGIGSMVERLLAGDVLTHATYTAIDNAPVLLTEARRPCGRIVTEPAHIRAPKTGTVDLEGGGQSPSLLWVGARACT